MQAEYNHFIGWDLGGAHVKVARVTENTLREMYQVYCPLWKGEQQLRNVLHELHAKFSGLDCIHAITMTGEMVDLFETRAEGVTQICKIFGESCAENEIYVFAGIDGFISIAQVKKVIDKIGSANWLVTANFIKQKVENALVVDIGSTTTDLVLIQNGQLHIKGYNDAQRLQNTELIYTGVIRTPIMALNTAVLVDNILTPMVAELFANMADVYRITGQINESDDLTETADGKDKSFQNSIKRLARMFGYDAEEKSTKIWVDVAQCIQNIQSQKIYEACKDHITKASNKTPFTLIGAGVGRFLLEKIAQRLGIEYLDFSSLVCGNNHHKWSLSPANCAPAVAAAYLMQSNIIA